MTELSGASNAAFSVGQKAFSLITNENIRIICSWGTFLTNAHAQTIICTQLFAGKLTNQNWENNKVNDNIKVV